MTIIQLFPEGHLTDMTNNKKTKQFDFVLNNSLLDTGAIKSTYFIMLNSP